MFSSKPVKTRFCSVVVITPDFDLESEIPATPVRIWARPTCANSNSDFDFFGFFLYLFSTHPLCLAIDSLLINM